MKLFGSLKELVSVVFRKDTYEITLRENQSTTYIANRDIQLPPGDAAHVLMSASSTATMTNKTFDADGSGNSITNIENADIKSGANIALSKLAAVTADRALVSNGSGVVSPSSVTATELGYVSGVTSAIQTQIDAKSTNPMTTAGDVIYAGASGTPARLAIGSNNTVFKSNGSGPSWAQIVDGDISASAEITGSKIATANGTTSRGVVYGKVYLTGQTSASLISSNGTRVALGSDTITLPAGTYLVTFGAYANLDTNAGTLTYTGASIFLKKSDDTTSYAQYAAGMPQFDGDDWFQPLSQTRLITLGSQETLRLYGQLEWSGSGLTIGEAVISEGFAIFERVS